ncbi:hypothetical protein CHS0354_037463 [Potamilus streckersoni]|uniref:Uncharacterized protein n=1 Tax=Potamilus streckersoni TaxID=2493646 RepID=A0AAE0RPH9_9BIVA|nr:hypothetical protein CHS0354_037463 [Potamilus streckersoni]
MMPPLILDSMILSDLLQRIPSLLETEQYVAPHGTAIIEPDFPEMESRSQSSAHSGSFKGTRVKRKSSSHQEKVHSTADQADRDDREDDDIHSSFVSSVPQLPPVHGPNLVLTPIGEASREHTQALSLPPVIRNGKDGEKIPAVNVQPPTPQHSILSNLPTSSGMLRDSNLATTPEMKEGEDDERWSVTVQEREYQQQLRRQREQDERRERKAKHRAKVAQQNIEYDAVSAEGKGMLPSGGSQLLSSSESLVGGSSHSTSSKALPRPQGWKGSTQSLRSYGSRKGPGSTAEEGSLRGSIIFGPDGEAILIGGKIAPTLKHHDPLHISEVQYANKHHTRDTSDESDAEVPDEWRTRQRIQSEKLSEKLKKYKRESPKSSVTEKEIVDALTEHAQKIAENILSSQDAGQNLEKDIRTMIEEIMKNQKRNSAGPTVAEYRDEIKKNLVTAITKAAGMEAGSIPLDAEIDPELMQALANQTLTPEDIEIIRDENGRSIIRSRTRMHQTMGGVKEGHIYMPATQANADQRKISIPADRAFIMDVGEPDVIHYGERPIHESASEKSPSERHPSPRTVSDKVSEKAQSLKGKSSAQSLKGQSQAVLGSVQGDASSRVSGATKSQVSFKEVESPGDDLAKTLADIEAAGSLGKEGAASLKSSKSGTSLKSSEEKSKLSDKSSKKEEKKEEFVVGRVDHTEENKRIYGIKSRKGKPKEKAKASAVKKPEVKKGGKKGKGKKKEKEVEELPRKEPSPEVLESIPPPPKALTPKQQTPKSETPIEPEREETPVTVKSEEEEDFIIVRDETYSPEPVVEPLQRAPSVTSHTSEEDDSKYGSGDSDMSDQDLKMISNREARNAKRAAAAEKRRQEVERKRREREEQLKREKEEQERQEKMKQELEELRRKKEEERRLKKLQEDEEAEREAREANELELRRQRELEREKRKKEEYAKKLEEMRKKQAEEEQRKAEEAERRRLEEEEERKREAEMLAAMAEEERIEYEKRKQLEEEERQKREAEEKRRREEEAQRAMELARKLAEEMARKQAELEARLRFNRSVQVESSGLDHTQDITRAFVFSYFELLQWLGLDIPEFELLKLNQY